MLFILTRIPKHRYSSWHFKWCLKGMMSPASTYIARLHERGVAYSNVGRNGRTYLKSMHISLKTLATGVTQNSSTRQVILSRFGRFRSIKEWIPLEEIWASSRRVPLRVWGRRNTVRRTGFSIRHQKVQNRQEKIAVWCARLCRSRTPLTIRLRLGM